MSKISIFLILFLSIGCLEKKDDQVFEARNFVEWLSATKVDILLPSLVNSKTVVARPPGAWLGLLRLTYFKHEALGYSSDCLFYRVPSKKLPGVLRVVKMPASNPCKDYQFKVDETRQLENVKSLKVFLSDERVRINENRFLEAGHLHLNFNFAGEDRWMKFPLLNRKKKTTYKRYDSSATQRFYNGVTVWPMESDKNKKKTNSSPVYLGGIADSYKEGTAAICHQVDKSCNDKVSFGCGRCKYGWYEVVDHRCPQGGSKYCAPSRCGELGQPACPRGYDYLFLKTEIVLDDICFQDSPYGFCNKGLHTYCDENHVLICL